LSSKVTQKLVSKQAVQKKQKFKSVYLRLHVLIGGAIWRTNIEGSVHKGSISRNPNFSGNEFLCFASFTS